MAISSLATGSYAAAQRLTAAVSSGNPAPNSMPDFASLVKENLQAIGEKAVSADREMGATLAGGTDLLGVVTAVAESETAVQTLVAVRDKVIAAYEDVMRMAI